MSTTTSRSKGGQGDLLDQAEAYARRRDPGTAHRAAQVMKTSGKADTLNRMIFDDLERLGTSGITSWEFSRDHPDAERVSVSPRFSALFLGRKIGKRGTRFRSGQKKGSPSGIYVLLEFATELADEEPKPNSPEDLGQVPPDKSFGESRPEPDPIHVNVASGTMQPDDARTFVAWVHAQDIRIHAQVTFGHVLSDMSGLTPENLRWLCQAIRQAKRAPAPADMFQAALKRDVGLLRDWED